MTTKERDPRRDPMPGDILRMGGLRYNREVEHVRDGVVSWVVGHLGYDATLAEWRKFNATSEIVKTAEGKEEGGP